MSEKAFLKNWYTGLAIAAGIVTAVAALLLAIIGVARGILNNASRALDTANQIVTNTKPIWQIEKTNSAANQLLDGARSIEHHATSIADALDPPPTNQAGS